MRILLLAQVTFKFEFDHYIVYLFTQHCSSVKGFSELFMNSDTALIKLSVYVHVITHFYNINIFIS